MTIENNDVHTALEGFLTEKYKEWCLDFPEKAADHRQFGGPKANEYLKVFHETAVDIFDDIFRSTDNDDIIKCNDKSAEFRNQGNKEYQRKENAKALMSYTNALLYAEPNTESVALAYANRSAVLLTDGEYSACLRDIERAFENNYSDKLKYKLHERKSKCLLGLKLFAESLSALENAEKALQDAVLPDDKKEQLRNEWTKQGQLIKKNLATPSSTKLKQVNEDRPSYKSKLPKVTSMNPKFPALSSAVDIAYSRDVGRHAVAARDIRAGELISVEDPVVSRLNMARRGMNCTHCFEAVLDYLPSPITNKDVFCSDICLKEAMSSYHPIESSFYHYISRTESIRTEWVLALRAVTQKTVNFFLDSTDFENYNPMYGTSPTDRADEGFVYHSREYKSIFNLVTLPENWKSTDHQLRAFAAYFFIHCLWRGNFFKTDSTDNSDQNGSLPLEFTSKVELIGALLVHFMIVARLNCYEVGVFEAAPEASWQTGSPTGLGMTFIPTLALFNHSCDPNLSRYNVACSTIVVANRDIMKGEEISDCYYSTYAEKTREERQEILQSKYFISCRCNACLENWPLHTQLPRGFDDAKLLISLEELPAKMAAIQKLGSTISIEQRNENYEKLITLYLEFIKIVQKTMKPPHSFYFMALRHIYKCFWIIKGSKQRAIQI